MRVNPNRLPAFFFLLLIAAGSYAQCAMCKQSAESSLQNGGTIANGINAGIIYLMGVPYMLLGTFCFIFRRDIAVAYHRWRKNEVPGSLWNKYRFMVVFFGSLSVIFLLVAYLQLKG